MDEDEFLMNAAAREVDEQDEQMIEFHVNVEPAPGGSQLVAEAFYMPPAASEYMTASWTSDRAQDAFGSAMAFLAGLSHSDIAFASE